MDAIDLATVSVVSSIIIVVIFLLLVRAIDKEREERFYGVVLYFSTITIMILYTLVLPAIIIDDDRLMFVIAAAVPAMPLTYAMYRYGGIERYEGDAKLQQEIDRLKERIAALESERAVVTAVKPVEGA